jgi:hypothetical protein
MGDRISSSETSLKKLSRWVELARAKSGKCFICARIASENEGGGLRPIKISGIEISADVQESHLARCVGELPGEA